MKTLRDFINGFDFIKMRPDVSAIKGGVPVGARVQALVEPGKAMAVYSGGRLSKGRRRRLHPPWKAGHLPEGEWLVTWVDPASGKARAAPSIRGGGILTYRLRHLRPI